MTDTDDNIVDPVFAMMQLISGAPGVSSIAGGRVFGAELGEDEQQYMPRANIVVNAVGLGTTPPGAGDITDLAVVRIDVRAYGVDPHQAAQLSALVDRYLHKQKRRTIGSVVTFWATRVAGPVPYRAAPGDWPVAVRTYDLFYATTKVA